jgi:dihydrofolate reductase
VSGVAHDDGLRGPASPIAAHCQPLRNRGDLEKPVQQLKRKSGEGLCVGGVQLRLALAELGLIDEDEFVVRPRIVGQGPTLFAGLSKYFDLKLVSRREFESGAVAMRYEPRR